MSEDKTADVVVGSLTFKRIKLTGYVICPLCRSQVGAHAVLGHLDRHDKKRQREELRDAGVGSFTKPKPGQLGFGAFGVPDVEPGKGGGGKR